MRFLGMLLLHLLEFTAPEKTWAYFLKSLRAADRKAALSAFVQGDLKVGLSQVMKSMDAEKMRAMADSEGLRPTASALLARAETWRPGRAYAAQHLWASA